jgi:hypothetical protein
MEENSLPGTQGKKLLVLAMQPLDLRHAAIACARAQLLRFPRHCSSQLELKSRSVLDLLRDGPTAAGSLVTANPATKLQNWFNS